MARSNLHNRSKPGVNTAVPKKNNTSGSATKRFSVWSVPSGQASEQEQKKQDASYGGSDTSEPRASMPNWNKIIEEDEHKRELEYQGYVRRRDAAMKGFTRRSVAPEYDERGFRINDEYRQKSLGGLEENAKFYETWINEAAKYGDTETYNKFVKAYNENSKQYKDYYRGLMSKEEEAVKQRRDVYNSPFYAKKRNPREAAAQDAMDIDAYDRIAEYAAKIGDEKTYNDALAYMNERITHGDALLYEADKAQRKYELDKLAKEDPAAYKAVTTDEKDWGRNVYQANRALSAAEKEVQAAEEALAPFRWDNRHGFRANRKLGTTYDESLPGFSEAKQRYDDALAARDRAKAEVDSWAAAREYKTQLQMNEDRAGVEKYALDHGAMDMPFNPTLQALADEIHGEVHHTGVLGWILGEGRWAYSDYMTPEQKATFSYYYTMDEQAAEQGDKRLTYDPEHHMYDGGYAKAYLDMIWDEVYDRRQQQRTEREFGVKDPVEAWNNEENWMLKPVAFMETLGYDAAQEGKYVGANFYEGGNEAIYGAIHAFDTDYPTYNSDLKELTQYESANSDWFKRDLGSAAYSLGMMAPSMMVGGITTGIAGTLGSGLASTGALSATNAGVTAAQIGRGAQNVMFFLGVKGNAYAEAKERYGMNDTQAQIYSVLQGASEVGLQNAIGGIAEFGGIGARRVGALVDTIDNALARNVAHWGLNVAGELAEENMQNYIEAISAAVLTGKEVDWPTLQDFLDTSISTIMMVSASNASETFDYAKQTKVRSNLVKIAKDARSMSGDYYAELADRIEQYIEMNDAMPEQLRYAPDGVYDVLAKKGRNWLKNEYNLRNETVGMGVSQNTELREALNQYAADNGIQGLDDAQVQRAGAGQQVLTDRQARQAEAEGERIATPPAEARNDSNESSVEDGQDGQARLVPTEQNRNASEVSGDASLRSENAAEQEQTQTKRQARTQEREEAKVERQEKRTVRQGVKAARALGQQATEIVNHMSTQIEGKTLAESEKTITGISEKYPALRDVVQDVARSYAARLYNGAKSLEALQTVHADNTKGLKDAGLRQAATDAYHDAVDRLAGNGDQRAKARSAGRAAMRSGALDLSVRYEAEGRTVESGIARISEDGKHVVLDNGDVRAVGDLELDLDTKDILTKLTEYGLGRFANQAFQQYQAAVKRGDVSSGYVFLAEYLEAMDNGRRGAVGVDELKRRMNLPGEVVESAYDAGRERAGEYAESRQDEVDKLRAEAKQKAEEKRKADEQREAERQELLKKEGVSEAKRKSITGRRSIIDKSGIVRRESELSRGDRLQMQYIEDYVSALGVDLVFIASNVYEGKYVGAQGAYINGKIVIDIFAGRNSASDLQSFMLRTLSHELTHFIEDFSPQLYAELKRDIFKVLGDKLGADGIEYLIDKKIKRSSNKNMTRLDAEHEIMADACEMMLKDSKAIDRLQEINPGLVQRILNWLKDTIKKLKKWYGSNWYGEAVHEESEALQGLEATLRQAFQDRWDDLLVKSTQAYGEAGKKNTAPVLEADVQTSNQMAEEAVIQNSDRLSDETIEFLDDQEHVTVYRAMQMIDGKLYPPMAAKVKGADGKTRLVDATEIGQWYQAVERPDLVKNGKFTLNKGNGSSIAAAYNPYFHCSASPLNDQFSSAYKRPNLVVVEGIIPKSELTSGYRAEGAKDAVGETAWHAGPVASKLKGDKARRVFLSRWFQVTRIMSDAEVASMVAQTLQGENVAVPSNVVTPSLLSELRKQGVPIQEKTNAGDGWQKSDREYLDAVKRGDTETAQRMVDEAAKKAGYTIKAYHGTYSFGNTRFRGAMFFTDRTGVARNFSGGQAVRNIADTFDADASPLEDVMEFAMDSTYLGREENLRFATIEDFDEEIRQNQYDDSIKRYGQDIYDHAVERLKAAKRAKQDFLNGTIYVHTDFNSIGHNYTNSPLATEKELRDFVKQYQRGQRYTGGGVYKMALRPGNMVSIDVHGNYYTNVPIPAELSKFATAEERRQGYAGTDQILRMADEAGYDTVKFSNMVEGGDWGNAGVSNVYAVMNAEENAKSADPVTYDEDGEVIPLSERFNRENDDIRYSERDAESPLQQQINQSMTMQQAKDMVQRVFVLAEIKEWYDGEYKNGDEWLKGVGAEEVAMYLDNYYEIQTAYLNRIPGIVNGDFFSEDVLDAYVNGTLTGKVKQAKSSKVDTAANVVVSDSRFYAPQRIADAKETMQTAMQRMTKANQDEVIAARAAILLYAHNPGAAETLGLTNAELNKKLRSWTRYSAKAREISQRINQGVSDSFRWTGIENSSWLNRATVSNDDVARMVKSVEGRGSRLETSYIARTMLALDTHIDWSWLSIKFDSQREVAKAHGTSKTVLGYYKDSDRLIHVTDSANTVAHEMGHALDYQWGRDFGRTGALTNDFGFVRNRVSGEARTWIEHFAAFCETLRDSSNIRSAYMMDLKETFARFVDRFVGWTQEIATGMKYDGYSRISDNFTQAQFVQFARLLQEKAAIDAKGLTGNKLETTTAQFSDRDSFDDMDETQLQEEKTRLDKEYRDAKQIVRSLDAEYNKRVDDYMKDRAHEKLESLEKWYEESGYKDAAERMKEAERQRHQVEKALHKATDARLVAEEQEAVKRSGLSEAEYFRKAAVKAFGYTPYFYDAGYILPNGKMLNFSGEKGRHYGTRGQDHRAIGQIYAVETGSAAMTRFMNDGNVRIMAESPGLDISKSTPLTREQLGSIRRFINQVSGEEYFNIDFSDERGNNIGSIEYEGSIRADRVINDIQHFFETSEVRQPSRLSAFYSERDYDEPTDYEILRNADPMKDATSQEQRAMLVETQKKLERIQQLQYRLNKLRKDIPTLDGGAKTEAENMARDVQKQIDREVGLVNRKLNTATMRSLLKAQRAQTRERVQGQYRERRNKTEIRRKIVNLTDTMRKQLLSPAQKKYIPQQFVGNVVDLLETLGGAPDYTERLAKLDSQIAKAATAEKRQELEDRKQRMLDRQAKAQDRINALKVEYDAIRNDEKNKILYDQTVSELLQELSGTVAGRTLNELSVDELSDVYTAARAIYTTIRNTIKADAIERGRTIFEAGEGMTRELRESAGAMATPLEKYVSWHLDARRMFNRFGGRKTDSYWNKAFNMLNEAQHKTQMIEMLLTKELGSILDTKRGRKMLEAYSDTGSKALVDVGLKDENGNTVRITRGMMMSIYFHMLNEDNARHVMYGGFTLPDVGKYYKGSSEAWGKREVRIPAIGATLYELSAQLSEVEDKMSDEYRDLEDRIKAAEAEADEDIRSLQGRIEEQMTDFDREFVAAAQRFFELSAEFLNDATRQMYGYSKANVKNYFPIHTDSDFLTASFENITKDMSLENMGFMKVRIKSSKPILLEDATKVINQQIGNVAKYAGMTQAIRTFQNAYSVQGRAYSDSVQKALKAFGKNGQQYVENLMSDLVGSRSQPGTIFDRLKGMYARGVLSANLSVTIKQAASYPTAAAIVGWGPLMHALVQGGRNNRLISRANRALIDTYTPLLWQRAKGAIDTEFGDIARGRDWTQKAGWLMNWIQKTDVATVGRLWSAAEYYVKKNNKGLEIGTQEQIDKGESPFYQEVARVFNRIVEETQPNYSVLQRPDILRNPNAMVRACTMFMTQRVQNVQIVYDAAGELHAKREAYKANKGSETARAELKTARQNMRNAITSQAVSTIVLNAMTLAAAALLHRMNPYRDDDDELTLESILKAYGAGIRESVSGSIVGGSEIYNLLNSLVTGEKYYEPDIAGWSTLTDFGSNALKVLESVKKWINSSDDNPYSYEDFLGDNYKRFMQTTAKLTGIPLENLYKIGDGIYQHIDDAMNGEFLSFESGLSRSNATNIRRLFNAWMDDDTEKVDAVLGEMRQAQLDKGKSEAEADKKILSDLASEVKKRYLAGEFDEAEALELLTKFGAGEEYAQKKLREIIKERQSRGDLEEQDAAELLAEFGGMDEDDAYWAADLTGRKAEADEEEDVSTSKYANLYAAIDANQDIDEAVKELTEHGVKESSVRQRIKEYLVERYEDGQDDTAKFKNYLSRYCGITKRDEVDEIVRKADCFKDTGVRLDNVDDSFKSGEITKTEAERILTKYGGQTVDAARIKVRAWEFQVNNPDLSWSVDQVTDYYDKVPKTVVYKSAKNAGISAETYDEYLRQAKTVQGTDKDGDGRTDSGSAKQAYIDMIAGLPGLTNEQREVLLRLRYDKPKKQNEDKEYNIPWH